MTLTEHKIWHLPLLILALWLGGCSMQYEDIDEPAFIAPGDLTLLVNVHTGDRNVKATRAYDNNDGVTFEPTTLDREKINTLRVIIVKNSDGLIVHNQFHDLTSAPAIFVNGLKYRVEYNTEYTVYLIGNEKGLPSDTQSQIDENALKPGEKYTANTLEEIQIGATTAGYPMIMGETTLVPMTEFFTVNTITKAQAEAQQKPDDEGVIQNETFFITRAASKFSFYFLRAEDFTVEENDPWTINNIKISGLGKEEFLFPKETVYYPAKDPDRTSINRDIKEFKLPGEEYPTGSYEFAFTTPLNVGELPVKKGEDPIAGLTAQQLAKCQLIPEMYFPESKGYGYRGSDDADEEYHFGCTISFDGNSYLDEVKLPNLPHALPRNTHVVVIVTIHDRYITATVDVIPFTEVAFDTSDYGLERESNIGYVVVRDENGNITHWYDDKYYEPVDPNNPPVKYYLGKNVDESGEPLIETINGKQYMLVYADIDDYEKPIFADKKDDDGNVVKDENGNIEQVVVGYEKNPGSNRTAAHLHHFFEIFTEKDEDGKTLPPHKYLMSPEGMTGYEVVKDMLGYTMYIDDMKRRVWLDDSFRVSCCRTINVWDRYDWVVANWPSEGVNPLDYTPICWFDVLGNRHSWEEGDTVEERIAILGEWVKYLE